MRPKAKNIFGTEVKYLAQDLKDLGAVGYYAPDTKTIGYEKALRGDELIHTILHEEFHAVLHRVGVWAADIPRPLEEVIVESLSRWIAENYKIKPK